MNKKNRFCCYGLISLVIIVCGPISVAQENVQDIFDKDTLEKLKAMQIGKNNPSLSELFDPSVLQALKETQNQNELMLDTNINQQSTGESVLYVRGTKGLYISEAELKKWRVKINKNNAMSYHGSTYIPLSNFSKLTYKTDLNKQTMELNIPAEYFEQSEFDWMPQKLDLPPPATGTYLTQDSNFQFVNGESNTGIGLFTNGIFSPYGFGTNAFTENYQTGRAMRLSNTWEIDNPDAMTYLRLGDTYTDGGMWGGSIAYGGVQWGNDFSLQPTYQTTPLYSANGQVSLPSTADIYLNDQLVGRREIPPGPFTINNIPAMDGAGNINVVTTDVLGRQQVVTVPYSYNAKLLKPGLSKYSYSIGLLRNEYGTEDFNYSDPMFVANYRVGVTNQYTQEWHAEFGQNQQDAGLGNIFGLSQGGILNAITAFSHASQALGTMLNAGYQNNTQNNLSYGLNAQWASTDFTQLGQATGTLAPEFITQATASKTFKMQTVGVSYFWIKNRTSANVNLLSISYSRSLSKDINLMATGTATLSGIKQQNLFLGIMISFGERTQGYVSHNQQSQVPTQEAFQLSRTLTQGPSLGYNMIYNQVESLSNSYQAMVNGQNNFGYGSFTRAYQNNSEGDQVEVKNSLIYMDHNFYLTRDPGNSFALVEVPGYENVKIYNQNQFVAVTDHTGNALVPNLLPYEKNKITIDSLDLPVNAQINETKIDVIPYRQSGSIVKFSAKPANAAIGTLVQKSGLPVPAGAFVRINGGDETYPVGQDGDLYLLDLKPGENTLITEWYDQVCHSKINFIPDKQSIMDLGKVVCE